MSVVLSSTYRTIRTPTFCLGLIGSHARHGCKASCALLLFFLLAVAGCRHDNAEAALRRQVQASIDALATHEHGAFMQAVAEDFVGPQAMDRQGASQMVRLYFLRFRQIRLLAGPLSVEMSAGRARVTFNAVLTGGQAGLLPDQAQAYQVDSSWRRDGGDWQMIALQWQPMAR